MEWSNETTMEFLDLYENEPVIWNASHPLHKNRNAVSDAWNRIQKEVTIDCSVIELKKKKESLMARFRQCLAKVKATSKSGTGTDDLYKPIWFAYEKMAAFLKNKDEPRNTINSVHIESQEDASNDIEDGIAAEGDVESGQEQENHLIVSNDDEEIAVIDRKAPRTCENETFKAPRQKKQKSRAEDTSKLEKRMDDASTILKASVQKNRTEKDECDIYGVLVATKLRKLNEGTRDYVMNQIDNLLFKAKTSPKQNYAGDVPQLSLNSQYPLPVYTGENEQFSFAQVPQQKSSCPSAHLPRTTPQWESPSYQELYSSRTHPSRWAVQQHQQQTPPSITPVPSPSPSSSDIDSAKSCYENFNLSL